MKPGKFITFEGIDGAGKSSHLAGVADLLRAHGLIVVSTREPGGTPLGEKLRELLLHEAMHLETETMLMFAARREHLAQVIEPALARGEWVSWRGLDQRKFTQLEEWVHGHLQPDLTLLFDLPCDVARQRMAAQTRELDRFEQERADFHRRVRSAYLERADSAAQRIALINADQPIEQIKTLLEQIVLTRCL